jgi:hypothetical protein
MEYPMATQILDRALGELLPRARQVFEQDLRTTDVIAVAGRFDTDEPNVYILSQHRFTAQAQLVFAARRSRLHYVAIARILKNKNGLPTTLQVLEITAAGVIERTAGVVNFREGSESIMLGGLGPARRLATAASTFDFEGVRALLHPANPATS